MCLARGDPRGGFLDACLVVVRTGSPGCSSKVATVMKLGREGSSSSWMGAVGMVASW